LVYFYRDLRHHIEMSNEMPVTAPHHVDEDFEDAVETPQDPLELLERFVEDVVFMTECDNYVGAPVSVEADGPLSSLLRFADGTTFRVTVE
jgi:hypothetical protein